MTDNLDRNRFQLLTLKQIAEKNPWPNESTLRTLYAKRKTNGLEKAFIRNGSRILVDEEKFFSLMKAKSGKNA